MKEDIKKFTDCIGEYKKYALLTPLFVMGEVIMDILIPYCMARIIDNGVLNNGGLSSIVRDGIIMMIFAIISMVFGVFAGKYSAIASIGFGKNLREKLFATVQNYSFSNIDKFSTASLITRITTDVSNIQNFFMMAIRLAVRAPFMLIGSIIMAVYMAPKLSLIFLASVPILGIVLYLIISNARPRFKKMLERYDDLNLNVQETLINTRTIKSFVREDYAEEKFNDCVDAVRKAQIFAEKLIILNMPIMQFTIYMCILSTLWFGGNMVIGKNLEVGQLSSFITYIIQILMSLMFVSMIFIMFVISKASRERIIEILNEEVDIKDSPKDDVKFKDGSIEFKNVDFSYNKNKKTLVLRNINLTINSGETIGIIGSTGSGKSSLVQLLLRLYDITDGSLKVGGNDIKDYKLDILRNNINIVLQKNVLFSGTIRSNLLWGNDDATDEEIETACRYAEAHDFIMSFPNGYYTELGQVGVNISGGQKQRLCIARAILKKPKILILDDSTSAIDNITESRIKKNLEDIFYDMTKIIIAQKISSVSDADKIVVLNNGEIDAIGTHDELIIKNEIYKEIYESQKNGVLE